VSFLPFTRRDGIVVLLIGLIALFARLDQIGITAFQYDEGRLSIFATDWLQGGLLPQRGVLASVGLPTGPLSIYLLAIPYVLFQTPLAATIFIALLNVGGVMALAILARRMFNLTVAGVTGLVFALNPWAILYSRKIWNPNFYVPLIVASLLCGWLGLIEKRRPWAQMLAVVLMLVAPQFHYQPWLVMPALLILMWQGRRNIAWGAIAAGGVLAILVWLPFLISLSANDITTLQSFSQTSAARTWQPRLAPWQQVADFVTGAGVDATAMLYVWAFLTPVVVTPNWVQIFGHYFTLILPALFVFVGLGAEQIIAWGRGRRVVIALVGGSLAVVLISQMLWWRAFLHELDTTYMKGGIGTPLHNLMDIRAALAPYKDVLIVGGDAYVTSDSSIWKPLLYGQATCVRDLIIAGGNVAVLPDHPFAVLVASYAAPYSLREFYTQTAPQVIPLRLGEDPYTIYRWDAAPTWTEAAITPVTAPMFENGVRLTGYALTSESIYLQWHIDRAGSRDNVQYFAHFFNAAGDKIGQRDTAFYDVQYWCAGDTIITRVDTPIPSDTARLGVGLYRLIEGKARGLSTIDEVGNPASGTIEIDLPRP